MNRNNLAIEEIRNMLLDSNMFKHLPTMELYKVAQYFDLNRYRMGETIFSEGDEGTFMCIVHEGRVSVIKTDINLTAVVMGTEGAGRAFGEMAVLDGERRSASCVAETDCVLLTLAKSAMNSMLEQQPSIGVKILSAIAASLSHRMRFAAGRLVDHLV
jgi:CRP/FNR family cyclic AMP-dependent transcriptional regulator